MNTDEHLVADGCEVNCKHSETTTIICHPGGHGKALYPSPEKHSHVSTQGPHSSACRSQNTSSSGHLRPNRCVQHFQTRPGTVQHFCPSVSRGWIGGVNIRPIHTWSVWVCSTSNAEPTADLKKNAWAPKHCNVPLQVPGASTRCPHATRIDPPSVVLLVVSAGIRPGHASCKVSSVEDAL